MWTNRVVTCLILIVEALGAQNTRMQDGKLNNGLTNSWVGIESRTEAPENRTYGTEMSTLLKVVSLEPAHTSTMPPEVASPHTDIFLREQRQVEERLRSLVTRLARSVEEIILGSDEEPSSLWEGRGKKKRKYKKGEMQFLIKALLGLKVALLGIVLPLGVIVAKVLSWKAVTLSLMAFMLAKIAFVKNLFMGKSSSAATPTPAAAPIVIHSQAPLHDHLWKRHSEPQIHVKPEVHVHQSEEQFHGWDTDSYAHRNWQWGEGRSGRGDHELAFRKWVQRKR